MSVFLILVIVAGGLAILDLVQPNGRTTPIAVLLLAVALVAFR